MPKTTITTVPAGSSRLVTAENLGDDPLALVPELPIELRARKWVDHLNEQFVQLDPQSVVVINLDTGDFVVGVTALEAIELFEARFGKDIQGWLHRLAGPIFVGGGLW